MRSVARMFDDDRHGATGQAELAGLLRPSASLIGTAGADRLVGTADADRIDGLAGDDQLVGKGGDDQLHGNRGGDTLHGNKGDDRLWGDRGADELFGGRGDDELSGQRGSDELRGGGGRDVLDGGLGADLLQGGSGADVFRFSALDGLVDEILDFDLSAGDQLDLSLDDPNASIDAFVQLRLEPRGTIVAVDPSGGGDHVDAALVVGVDLTTPLEALTDPIPQPITPGAIAVELVDVAQAPPTDSTSGVATGINYLFHADDGSGRLFLADTRGQISIIRDGQLLDEPFLDVAAVLGTDFLGSLGPEGLRTFAFHPDFDDPSASGFNKLYTAMEQTAASSAAHPDTPILAAPGPLRHYDVITEWTVDPTNPDRVDPDSAREVLRIEQPGVNHNIGRIAFNPNAAPGDPDHGLLYLPIGDGGAAGERDVLGQGQDPSTPLGTILRIDPLQDGASPYSVPADNPFVGDSSVLPEVWAYGFRHPQRLSWDTEGDGVMLIADIGENQVEEINLGIAGANYGWNAREGTFVFDQESGTTLFELPPYDASFDLTYPVAQYDHDDGDAITGGFVYRGDDVPALIGKYVFGDIVNGRVFYVDVDDLEPGRQAEIEELTLLRDGEPVTLLELVGAERADLRFGQGEDGEIYLTTKQDGMVRALAPAEGLAPAAASDTGPALTLDALLTPEQTDLGAA
jgi:glucose/arabinose dehydrogenase